MTSADRVGATPQKPGQKPGQRRGRGLPAVADRGLLVAGLLILAATLTTVGIAVGRFLSGAHGPVLPVSWCRTEGSGEPLPPLRGSRWFTSWQVDWIAVAVLSALAALYLAGVLAVRRQRRNPWPAWRTVSFLAGLGVAALATMSAIAVYDMTMFSAHMLGHLALVMVAPPLLVAGHPMTLALHATRNPWHGRIRRLIRSTPFALWFSPPVALATYTIAIVATHMTGLMDEIMTHPWLGQVEHATYLLVGYQFFALAIGNEPLRWRLPMLGKQVLLALAMAVDTFAGVILLTTTKAIAMSSGGPEGIDALTETHMGGAIMWVGGDGIMAVAMIVVGVAWARLPEAQRRNAAGAWLETARRSTLFEHADAVPGAAPAASAGSAGSAAHDIDSDEQALAGYNAWLADLARHEQPGGPGH